MLTQKTMLEEISDNLYRSYRDALEQYAAGRGWDWQLDHWDVVVELAVTDEVKPLFPLECLRPRVESEN